MTEMGGPRPLYIMLPLGNGPRVYKNINKPIEAESSSTLWALSFRLLPCFPALTGMTYDLTVVNWNKYILLSLSSYWSWCFIPARETLTELGKVVHDFNHYTREAEAGRWLNSRPVCSTVSSGTAKTTQETLSWKRKTSPMLLDR